jgi:hypothetical protein
MKTAVFRDDVQSCLGRLVALMMAAVSNSEKPVNVYHSTLRNIPEDSHLQYS